MLHTVKKWMARCLAIVLTTVMFLSLLPETASAVSSIGLSYSQPSAGSGKLYLYWDSVPNVEFYAYSVRDITTGESIKSNERTSGTSVSVRWTWENNHSYRVWAGACCTGNDPDNTSTWDYAGMDTFTIVGCPHRNTDVGWDINEPMTYKSISDSEHKVTGYLYEYCTECFEHIGDSYKVTETYPHTFDAAGDCIECDYRRSCQHKETKLVVMDGYPAYKQINDKEHKCTTAYNRVCANASCGKVVKMNDSQSSETQPHRFDSNGRCKDCGYMKTYEALRLGVSRSKAEAYVGDSIGASASASGGDGQYRYEWEVSLNGQVIDRFAGGRDDAYSRTASSVGQYVFTVTVTDGQGNSKTASSQSITVKEKTCEHTSYTDVPGTVKYSQISDAMHKKTTLIRRVCDNCKTTLNEYKKDESEAHHFANGTCTECGAADPSAVCKHKHTTDQLAYSSITGQGNTQQHIVTDSYNVVCNDCGVTIRHYESKRMQDHSLNADGVCKCGYSQPKGCDHANKREIFLRVISYVDKGTVGHEKTSVYRIECADCGIVLTAEKNITVVEDHSYTNNNQCVCGAQGHLHDFEQILISGPSYTNFDGDTHTVTTVYQKKCKTCGYLLDKETETRQEKHSFTKFERMDPYHNPENNMHLVIRSCPACGAEKPTGYDLYKYCTQCHPTPAPTVAPTPAPVYGPPVPCTAGGEHQWEITYQVEHPHQAYLQCKVCGETKDTDSVSYLPGKAVNCCGCGNHVLGSVYRDKDKKYYQHCTNCSDYRIEVSPSSDMKAYYAVKDRQDLAASAASNFPGMPDGTDKTSWTHTADLAMDTLTKAGFVGTTNAVGAASDMAGTISTSVKDGISGNTWEKQQTEIWEELIRQMLTNDTASSNDISDKILEATDSVGVFNTVASKFSDILDNEEIGDACDEIDDILTAIEAFTEGSANANKLKQKNKEFAVMMLNSAESINKLDTIINAAKASGNTTLVSAAMNVKDELEQQTKANLNSFTSALDNLYNSCQEEQFAFAEGASNVVIDSLIDEALSSLPGMEWIQLGGVAASLIVDWGAAYDAAEEVMTLSVMNNQMNIYNTLSQEDSDIMADLWAYLQMRGCDAASNFLQEYEDANFLSTKEFDIGKDKLGKAKGWLNTERKLYEQFIRRTK